MAVYRDIRGIDVLCGLRRKSRPEGNDNGNGGLTATAYNNALMFALLVEPGNLNIEIIKEASLSV